LTAKTAGKMARPISASTQSVTNRATPAMPTMNTTPTANGNGAIGNQVASTSLFAFDSSEPVGWRWCQASGSSRYLRVTRRRYVACRRNCITPAPSRRPRIPATLSVDTATMAAAASPSAAAVVRPESNAGTIRRPVIAPRTYALPTVTAPNSALPSALTAKIRGSSRTEIHRIRNPRRRTSLRTTALLSPVLPSRDGRPGVAGGRCGPRVGPCPP
jgi:hypothetical protein